MSPERAQLVSKIIFEYAAQIGAELDPDRLLVLNANLARDLSGAERCSVWLAEPAAQAFRTVVAHGVGELRLPFGQGLVGACYDARESIVVNDAASDPRFFRQMDEKTSFRTESVLAIPLLATDGRPLGVLQALNKPGGFSNDDVSLLGLAAAYSASALENNRNRKDAESARALHRELEIAKEVQMRLFPAAMPTVSGIDISAFCSPAKSIGGDYYDLIEFADGRIAFTVGDVAGKGIPAAVLMASLQASLRTQLVGDPGSLAALMRSFNDTILSSVMPGRYSTLFCGLYDPHSGNLDYVNCGHVAPFLFRSEGYHERLDVGGPPVGLLRGAAFEAGSTSIHAGDVLFCCSDGISEVVNEDGEMWEEDDLLRLIQGLLASGSPASFSSESLVDGIARSVRAYMRNAEPADDMTMLVIRQAPQTREDSGQRESEPQSVAATLQLC
jgi:phosphoserine phosphatase RsbU/P